MYGVTKYTEPTSHASHTFPTFMTFPCDKQRASLCLSEGPLAHSSLVCHGFKMMTSSYLFSSLFSVSISIHCYVYVESTPPCLSIIPSSSAYRALFWNTSGGTK